MVTTAITVISCVLVFSLSWAGVEFEDEVLVGVCALQLCGPSWWLGMLWLCRKYLRRDIYLVAYTAAVVSLLPPLVSLAFEAFLYFFDDDTLSIQATLAATQLASIYMQLHLLSEVGKISSTKGAGSTYGNQSHEVRRSDGRV